MARTRLIATSEGTQDHFGPAEWALLAGVAGAWGSAYLLISVALEGFSPFAVAFLRVALGAALLTLIPAARRGPRPEPHDRVRIALLGLVWIAIPLTLFPLAQQSVSSAVAGMLTGAQPVLAATIAALLLGRLPDARLRVGLGIGVVGVVAIAWGAASGAGGSSIGGIALVLAAVLCYALGVNIAVPLQQRYGGLPVIRRTLVVGAVLTLPGGAIGLADSHPTAGAVAAVIPLGLICTGIGYVLFATLAGRAGASRGSIAIYLIPVVALVLGVVFRGDAVSALELVGIALVLAGAWLARGPRRPPP
jgi:drug/metabolite transporter (DMT)-like permease